MKLPMTLPALSQLRPRERLLAIGSGIALLVVVLDRMVLSPWWHHAQTLRQEIRKLEETLLTHERLAARRERVFAELDQYQRYLRQAIADDLQMASLLTEIQDLAGQSQILVSEIKPLPTESDDLTKRYALEVRFECRPDSWVEFIFGVERSPSLFEVVRASLSQQEGVQDRLEGYLRVTSATLQLASAGASAAPEGTHALASP